MQKLVLYCLSLFFFALSLGCFVVQCSLLQSLLWAVVVAYLPSYLDGSEYNTRGRVWPEVMRWKGWGMFMKGTLKVDGPLNGKQTVFAQFPHGVMSYGHLAMVTDALGWFSGEYHKHERRDLGASIVYKIPLYRELLLWLGMVDAGKSTATKVLKDGYSLYILPGGIMEQMLTIEGRHRVYLNTRQGFIRLAVEFGADLVPIYTFGETDLYSVSSFLLPFRLWIAKTFYVATPLCYTKRYGIPLPYVSNGNPLHVVVGRPISVERISPSDARFNTYVDEKHAEFISALRGLFDKYKGDYGYATAELEVLPALKEGNHSKESE